MQYSIDGLVLRELPSGDNDKLLTLLTAAQGRITVMAKGSRSFRSYYTPAAQMFVYGNFELYSKGEGKWVRNASVIEEFGKLQYDIKTLALASYIVNIADEVSLENESAEELLKLTLNSLFALNSQNRPPELIKGAFELRVAAMSGFMPDVSACRGCRCESAEIMYLDVMNGRILCTDCMRRAASRARLEATAYDDIREANVIIPMSAGVTQALRYVLYAQPSRFLSFSLEKIELDGFASAAEAYLLNHIGHGYETLEYYKSLR